MHTRILALLMALSLLVVSPSTLFAQNGNEKLSELLPNLYIDAVVGNLIIFEDVFPGSRDLIDVNRQLQPAFQINDLLGNQLSSFPLGSSAGGFTWTFDPAMGTFNRASNSFGPTFAERALTVGRRRFNVGVNYQRATFDQIEGKQLSDGEIQIFTGVFFDLLSDGVFIVDALNLKVTTDTVGFFANYGVTDRLDVGVAIPVIRVDLEATLSSRVGSSTEGVGDVFFTDARSGSASGIGDVVVRAKFNFLKRPGGGLAGGVDIRLPTGDELDLLGLPGAQGKFYLAASTAFNKLSPHVNVGYSVAGESDAAADPESFVFPPPDEVNYTGGVDYAVTPRTTLAFDVVGRTLRDIGRLDEVATEFGTSFREFSLRDGSLHLLLGAAGVKFNPWSNMLLSANFLFPLSDRGLTDNLTWVVGFDYSF